MARNKSKSVVEMINRLVADWAVPRNPKYAIEDDPEFDSPEQCSAVKARGKLAFNNRNDIPDDIKELWGAFSIVKLFEEVPDMQWGLALLDYKASEKYTPQWFRLRPQDFLFGDRVIGRFIGDNDVLLVRCDPSKSDFGSIIAGMDEGLRNEWHLLADSLSSFIEKYATYEGRKYWEPQSIELKRTWKW